MAEVRSQGVADDEEGPQVDQPVAEVTGLGEHGDQVLGVPGDHRRSDALHQHRVGVGIEVDRRRPAPSGAVHQLPVPHRRTRGDQADDDIVAAHSRPVEPFRPPGGEAAEVGRRIADRHPITENPLHRLEVRFDHATVEPVHAARRLCQHRPGGEAAPPATHDRPQVGTQHELAGIAHRAEIGRGHAGEVGPPSDPSTDPGPVEDAPVVRRVRIDGASHVARQVAVRRTDGVVRDWRRHG